MLEGIVTLHDLVETLVGDIDDRTDLPKPDDIEKTDQVVCKRMAGKQRLCLVMENLSETQRSK